ncbi:MurR/RpiR family transcriptional regulator [Lactobacillus delbrueckii]|uniref:MurR/RpiR family transcriptional regulator n=1 Tax=Lactobacillus delbrueckii TaxID=1584 RepID=UPI001F44550C|nr:MurR/RpiR family transcriptional regulator [Lactobacillus delbrueckii]
MTQSKLSQTEEYLWDLIQSNPQKCAHLSIEKLAEMANVSTATVVRTMKKQGYSGYTEFRQSALRNSDQPRYEILTKVNEKIRKVIIKNQTELENTIELLDENVIEDSVQEVINANKVYIFARGLSELIAQEMIIKLQLLGKIVQMHDDPEIMRTISKNISADSVGIFITLNGNTQELVDVARNLNKKDITTITFTTNINGRINEYSDLTFLGFKSKTSYFKNYEVHSRLPLQIDTRIFADALAQRLEEMEN